MEANNRGIKINHISMKFGTKYALKDVSLFIKEGTIHSIVGENGAGKSTLMNILNSVLVPSSGEVLINDKKLNCTNPKDATCMGIGMVHQHFMLVPSLKVWQNIILGAEPLKSARYIDKKSAFKKIRKACEQYGIELNLEQQVGELTVGQQQKIEILKVLYRDAQYIVLDEPTAVLIPEEINALFESIQALKAMGKTIIFISHKLNEVTSISDEITVIQDGKVKGTVDAEGVDPNKLVRMMIGRDVDLEGRPSEAEKKDLLLEVQNLSVKKVGFSCGLNNVSLDVHGGEILGIAGVDGNGQSELVEALLGLTKGVSGHIIKDGKDIINYTCGQIRDMGVACIPPDRQQHGLVMQSSIKQNMVLGCESMSIICNGPFISGKKVENITTELCEEFDVRMSSTDGLVSELSGGNQQKVILARECGIRKTNLIIAVSPTRGLDIGAIEFVYSCLEKYKKEGKAILLISTELSDILRLSDRIAVMFKGRIMGTLDNTEDLSVDEIGSLMAGIDPKGEEASA